MKRTYRHSANAGNSTDVESNYGVSQTQPDMALTVREIMSRFASGTLPNLAIDQEFTEDLPDLRGLDISERVALRDRSKALIDKEVKRLQDKPADPPADPPSDPPADPVE